MKEASSSTSARRYLVGFFRSALMGGGVETRSIWSVWISSTSILLLFVWVGAGLDWLDLLAHSLAVCVSYVEVLAVVFEGA